MPLLGGAKLASPGTSASNTVAVLQNWNEREFIEGVQLGLAQLTPFLNDFGKCIDHPALSHRLLLALATFFKFDDVQSLLLRSRLQRQQHVQSYLH